MIWNGDCAVDGCEREAVNNAGFCRKHAVSVGSKGPTAASEPENGTDDRGFVGACYCPDPCDWCDDPPSSPPAESSPSPALLGEEPQ